MPPGHDFPSKSANLGINDFPSPPTPPRGIRSRPLRASQPLASPLPLRGTYHNPRLSLPQTCSILTPLLAAYTGPP